MLKSRPLALALASLFLTSAVHAGRFADSVVAYDPGHGFAPGLTNASAALGSPSRQTVDPQFGTSQVDPFDPSYLSSQVVSLGASGSLTVRFNQPILNDPRNPYGLDFLIFGNSGFTITNGNFSGGGITDGSLFGNNTGATRVSVSADNIAYFTLNPSLAPVVDGLFPTDGAGDFSLPVNPDLRTKDFSGKNRAGVRALYGGSAGGTGYAISWAQNNQGQSAGLSAINFVRVDILSGVSEIGGFSVVPEPTPLILLVCGSLLVWTGRRRVFD